VPQPVLVAWLPQRHAPRNPSQVQHTCALTDPWRKHSKALRPSTTQATYTNTWHRRRLSTSSVGTEQPLNAAYACTRADWHTTARSAYACCAQSGRRRVWGRHECTTDEVSTDLLNTLQLLAPTQACSPAKHVALWLLSSGYQALCHCIHRLTRMPRTAQICHLTNSVYDHQRHQTQST
jgi:hypothetical protein